MNISRTLICIYLLVISIASSAQISYIWKEAESGGYKYRYVTNDPSNSRFYALKNGLTVILSVNKDEPRMQTIIATKAGSKNDPADHTGLAHYLEHMLFKGTDKYGSKDWSQEKPLLDKIEGLYELYNQTKDTEARKQIYHVIDSVSGLASNYAIANEYDKMMSLIGAKGTNAFTSFEQTAYINDIPSNQTERWLAIEAERFRNPVLRLFHTELEAVYEEKNIGMDEDDTKVFETMFASLFQKHNYGLQTTIGTIEHLKNPSLTAIKNYYNKNYVPNNMVVIIAGDLDPDAMIAQIDKNFSFMQPKPVQEYKFEPEAPITAPIEKTIYGPDAEYVQMCFRFPGANTRDALLLDVMSSLLSNGRAGLMDLNLVLKQKVLESSAGSWALKDYSVLFIQGKAKEGQSLEEVKKLMLEQVENLKKGNFDDDIIKAVVNNNKKENIELYESNSGRAFTLLNAFTSGVDWVNQLDKINIQSAITKKDIIDFCNKNLLNNYVVIYKKTGEDKNVEKVEKPPITPVEMNRDDQSTFLKKITAMNVPDIQPQFLDFDKDVQRGSIKKAPLYTVPNKNNELFNLYYVFDMGKNTNRKLPIAINYLQYLGTDKISAENVNKEFYKLACDFDVSSGDEQVYVSLSGLQENFEPALKLFENLLTNAKADNTALTGMIEDMIKKRQDDKLNKNIISYEALNAYALRGELNPFNDVLPNNELRKITSTELVDIIHNLTQYEHKILYYGPVPVSQIQEKINAFHKIPDALKPCPKPTIYPYRDAKESEVFFVHYDNMKQAQITWTRKASDFDAALFPIVSMYNEYFGNGMSAIVFQTLRESKALAYSTYSVFSTPSKKENPFTIFSFIGTQADKFNEAVQGMNSLLDTLPQSDKLFTTAKQSLKNSIASSRTVKSSILFSYLLSQKRGLDYDIKRKVYDNIDGFTFDDLKQFHADYYSHKPYTYSILGDQTKLKQEDMQKLGKFKALTLKDIFGY